MPLYIYSRLCLSRSDAATNQESCVEVEPTIHLWIYVGECMTPHRPRKCPQTRSTNKHNGGEAVRFELPLTPLSESTLRPRDAALRKYLLSSSSARSWPKAIGNRAWLYSICDGALEHFDVEFHWWHLTFNHLEASSCMRAARERWRHNKTSNRTSFCNDI